MSSNTAYALMKELITPLDIQLYMLDLPDLQLIWSAGSMKKITGYDPLPHGLDLVEYEKKFCHPKDREVIKDRFDLLKSGRISCWSGFYRLKHIEQKWTWVYSRLAAIRSKTSGKPEKVSGIMMATAAGPGMVKQLDVMFMEAKRFIHSEKLKKLTPREIVVIRLIVEGDSYTEIAGKLSIQPDTVNRHRKNILQKLGLNNIAMLVCFAKEVGLA